LSGRKEAIVQMPAPPLVLRRGSASSPGAIMEILSAIVCPLAAAGYAFVYLLAGGGLGGAILIFIVAKLLGK
jgi:hypothetical protein